MEKKLLIICSLLYLALFRDVQSSHAGVPLASDSYYQVMVPQAPTAESHNPSPRLYLPQTPRARASRPFSRNLMSSQYVHHNGNGHHNHHNGHQHNGQSVSDSLPLSTVSPSQDALFSLVDFQPYDDGLHHQDQGSMPHSVRSGFSSSSVTSVKDPSLRVPSDLSSMPINSNWSSLRSENEEYFYPARDENEHDFEERLDQIEEHLRRNHFRQKVYLARLKALGQKALEKQEMLAGLTDKVNTLLQAGAKRSISTVELERQLSLLQGFYNEILQD